MHIKSTICNGLLTICTYLCKVTVQNNCKIASLVVEVIAFIHGDFLLFIVFRF